MIHMRKYRLYDGQASDHWIVLKFKLHIQSPQGDSIVGALFLSLLALISSTCDSMPSHSRSPRGQAVSTPFPIVH